MISLKRPYEFQSIHSEGFKSYLYEKSLSVGRGTLEGEKWYCEALDRQLAAKEPDRQRLTEQNLMEWLERKPCEKKITQKSGLILQSVFAGICRRRMLPLKSRPLSSGMHSRNTSLISLRKMKYGVFLMRQTGTNQPEDRRTLRLRFRPLSGYSTDVGYAAMS